MHRNEACDHDLGTPELLSLGIAVAIIIIALITTWWIARPGLQLRLPVEPDPGDQLDVDNEDVAYQLGNDLIVDIASRYNEAIVQNLDALDIVLLTILGVNVAFSVFGLDKIFRLDCSSQTYAIHFLAGSLLAALLGHVLGILWAPRDGIKPGQGRGLAASGLGLQGGTLVVMAKKTRRFPMAPSLRRLGKQLAEQLDIRPLAEGESRPKDFYTSNHVTGGSAKSSVVRTKAS